MHKSTVLGSLTLLVMSQLAHSAETIDPTNPTRVSSDIDVALTSEVKDALRDSGIAKTGEIRVETSGRIVQLSGFVDSESTQELALQAASKVDGVDSVRNDLVVRDSVPSAREAKDDTVIAAKVRKQLRDEAGVKAAGDISVEVNEGVVQLSGFVDSVEEKNRAADAVAAVAGVKDVRNGIALGR